MSRDVGYAIFAALGLSMAASVWAFFNAPTLADPGEPKPARAQNGALPIVPVERDTTKAQDHALAVLRARDLFTAPKPADMASLRRLARATITPPVQLTPVESEPDRPVTRRVEPPRPTTQAVLPARPDPRPLPPVQSVPPPQPQAIAGPQPVGNNNAIPVMRDPRFPLTLRGIFPDPETGVRAMIGTADGRIASTSRGGVVSGYRVVDIGNASITIQERSGRVYRLVMPGYGRL